MIIATHEDCVKLRQHLRALLEGRDIGNRDKVEALGTMGATTFLVYASINGMPEQVFEVLVRPVTVR